MKNKTLSLAILMLCSILGMAQQQLNVIPAVQEWKYLNEEIPFETIMVQWPDNTSPKQTLLLERFKTELQSVGVHLSQQADENTLTLVFDSNYKELQDASNAYEIRFDQKSTIVASSYSGMVYATRSLLQLLAQNKYKKQLPKGIVKDYPSYEKRMVLLDVARKFFTIDEIKDFIRIMAWVKMNEFHLHLSDNSWGGYSAYRLESKLYPELTAKDGHYTWDEIDELQEFAASYGITITPEIDSPGHSLAFTNIRPDLKSDRLSPNYLDITNPDTYVFMEEILGEVIPHFYAPDFHLGTDEYRIHRIKDDSVKYVIGNTFRKYINHFNKVVKRHGKTTRIWSGFEHMPGDTEIDKDIIIDMWETSDAQDKSEKGYHFINSTHFYTYIVPGAPYYGVDNQFIYEKWTPEIFSDKAEQNLSKGSRGLMGSKMHIWNDFGPTGYTTSEIARHSLPTIVTFSEKMWGTKGSDDYLQFQKRMDQVLEIPNTQILNRSSAEEKTFCELEKELDLTKKKHIKIDSDKKYLEYPWSLEMTLKRKKSAEGNELLICSKEATIYTQLQFDFKKDKKVISKLGFAIVRANQTEGESPLTSHRPQAIVFDYQLPVDKEVNIKIVGEKGKTSLFVDNMLVGSENLQMICPLEHFGSQKDDVFPGIIKQLKARENKDH
ncbi:hypothetical protein DF185_01375 [Marinifilum breve]|uniref:Uncharacterized protein n=1 Tax=Marinifilum breve TaxID=2184082 RepID=A0A2V4A292_9BACT|nr:glycoside hydrolase family 20 protein [Marinifilum breve]PXY02771.1 hypothetical protein DF185_01375 [Marinifilum breve]